jgi:nucleoid DNA-binding protein
MLKPENYIQNLLFDNDCVVIPDFGGFIKRQNPAYITPNGMIKPRGESLFFNHVLTTNDGLLLNSIAKNHGVSYVEAAKLVRDWVAFVEKEMEEKSMFKFGALGTFYVNMEGKKWFSPNPKVNLSKDSYGLEAVVAKTIAKNLPSSVPMPSAAQAPLTVSTNRNRKWIKAIAASVVLALLASGSIIWKDQLASLGSEVIQQAQMFSFSDTFGENEVKIKEETKSENIQKTETPVQPIEVLPEIQEEVIQNPTEESILEPSNPIVEEQINSQDFGNYYTVMVGAFEVEQNAKTRELEMTAKGYEVYPINGTRKNITKIQTGKFSSMKIAEQNLNVIREFIPGAYITEFQK